MSETTSPDTLVELIVFRSGAQDFCVEIKAVREIRSWTDVTPLPHTPDYVRGVINLRGAVLPIVDFSRRLGRGTTELTARSVIIVVQIRGQLGGLLVDAVSDILALPAGSLQSPPAAASGTSELVTGLFAHEGQMLSLIGLEGVLPLTEAAA